MCDLGVIIDGELTIAKHIAKITRLCYYHLRRLKQVRRILVSEIAARIVSAYVINRLDNCNSVLAGLPKASIILLQRVQNAVARLIKLLGLVDNLRPSQRSAVARTLSEG